MEGFYLKKAFFKLKKRPLTAQEIRPCFKVERSDLDRPRVSALALNVVIGGIGAALSGVI